MDPAATSPTSTAPAAPAKGTGVRFAGLGTEHAAGALALGALLVLVVLRYGFRGALGD